MSAMDMYWAAPPISRTITAAAVVLSVSVWLIPIVSPYYVVFIKSQILTIRSIPQLWRLVTTFILTGPKLGLIMDPYFLYTYGSALETTSSSFSQSADFVTYLLFVCSIILILGGVLLDGVMLLSPLTLALAYTYAQENANRQVSYFIVTFSAKWLPYAMLLATLLMASPEAALLQATGLAGAHTYNFLTKIWPQYGGGSNYVRTPAIIQKWFNEPAGTATSRGAGTAFSARPAGTANRSGTFTGSQASWTSGMWNQRGQGHRLGGD